MVGNIETARLLFAVGSLVGSVVFGLEGRVDATIALAAVGGVLLLQWVLRRKSGSILAHGAGTGNCGCRHRRCGDRIRSHGCDSWDRLG